MHIAVRWLQRRGVLKAVVWILGVTLWIFGFVERSAGAAPFVYVTNVSSDSVSVIDTATNTLVTSVGVGTHTCWASYDPGRHFRVRNKSILKRRFGDRNRDQRCGGIGASRARA